MKKIPSLNGLRALSIILVLFHHLMLENNIFIKVSNIKWLFPFLMLISDGQLGVNIFFVISGFLITSLLINEQATKGNISLKNFYMRRALRIFPAYYTLLIFYFIVQHLGYLEISTSSWIAAITYSKSWNSKLDWQTGHLWSLSVEEYFYLFWPFLFKYKKGSLKTLVLLCIVLVPIIRVLIYFYPNSWKVSLLYFFRIDAIAMGCLFALYKDEIIKKMKRNWLLFFFSAVFCVLILRYLPKYFSMINADFVTAALGTTTGLIANISIGIILIYSAFGPKKVWFKFLNLEALNFIGILSYSIYLWQQFFICQSGYWYTQFPQNILIVVVFACSCHYLIEKPFLKLKTKFSVNN